MENGNNTPTTTPRSVGRTSLDPPSSAGAASRGDTSRGAASRGDTSRGAVSRGDTSRVDVDLYDDDDEDEDGRVILETTFMTGEDDSYANPDEMGEAREKSNSDDQKSKRNMKQAVFPKKKAKKNSNCKNRDDDAHDSCKNKTCHLRVEISALQSQIKDLKREITGLKEKLEIINKVSDIY